MNLICCGGFGCSVGGQSTIDQSTNKENQSNYLCVCEHKCVVVEDVCLRVRVQPIMVDYAKTCH